MIPTVRFDELEAGLVRAYLEIVSPSSTPDHERTIPFRFNPADYQLKKAQTIAEIGIPGLPSPVLQWIRGGAETLTFDALFDTTHSLEDVDVAYVRRLRRLLDPDRKKHAPPIVGFVWGPRRFEGLLDGLTVSYTLFTASGTPLRAKASITLKEYRAAEVQVVETPRSSPDVVKTYLVRRGDTLPKIAAALFQDPTKWREIARANQITDIAQVRPGLRLVVPRLR